MTNLEKLQAAQALRVKESSWIPRTVGWLGTKGWGAAKYLAPKALKGPKISQGPRRALGWLGQSYGGAASGVGNFGLRNSKHGGKFFKALRDLGYQGQNFGTLQRDIIGNQALKYTFRGGGLNPANLPKWAMKNWTGIGLANTFPLAYFGASPLDAAFMMGGTGRTKPPTSKVPTPHYPSNYPRY